jgi:ACR3 family arsenite efflux pump ArsB
MCVRACAVSGCHNDALYKFVVTSKCISMVTVYTALWNGDPDRISVRARSGIFYGLLMWPPYCSNGCSQTHKQNDLIEDFTFYISFLIESHVKVLL